MLWCTTFEETRIPLMPGDFPAAAVPPRYRWHLSQGVAYLGADPTEYGTCRLKHSAFCPAISHPDLEPHMVELVARLRVRMDRLTRAGFVPATPPRSEAEIDEPDPHNAAPAGHTRHILHYYTQLLIAPGPLRDLQCIATEPDGTRCPRSVYVEDEGRWQLVDVPPAPGRAGQLILTTTGGVMWVWALSPQAEYQDILRWVRQHCPAHGTYSRAPDALGRELVTFDPLRHADYILTRPPRDHGPTERDGPAPAAASPTEPKRTRCAGHGCTNSTVMKVTTDWLCYQCAPRARQRTATHRRWQHRPTPNSDNNDHPDAAQ